MSIEAYSASAAHASATARGQFIRRTYLHLALAILAFVAVETVLLSWSGAESLVVAMTKGSMWLITLLAFMVVSMVADRWARSNTSRGMQYLGLGLYVLAEAVIFLPLLYVARYYSSPEVIPVAGFITLLLFAGLTFSSFTLGTDFSFLRGILTIGGFLALGVIVASILFGFELGTLFACVMVVFAGATILYQTSNVLRHYRTDQHVAASLALFASVALMFWYVLRIVMSSRR